jgi:putative PEP-CTERM system histidine kinase
LVANISVTGYALAATAYLVFTLLLLTGWRGRLQGGLLVLATGFTVLWAATLAAWSGWGIPGSGLVQTVETLHLLVWLVFMMGMMRYAQGDKSGSRGSMRNLTLLIYGLALVLLIVPFITGRLLPAAQSKEISFFGYVLLTVCGLFLVENLYRNTRTEQRWGIKFLCLGIGGLFAYDFFMYAQALLFKQLDISLWSARGAVYALVAPLIGISAARNPQWSLSVFISRKLVFHTATLLAAGAYLLLMAAAGYYIKTYGGEWGGALQVIFLFGAAVVLLALLFSGQVRARLRVFLGKHFFQHRYDYREQWLNFTNALSSCKQEALPHECVVRAIADVVDSPGGLLWLHRKDGCLEQISHWGVSAGEGEVIEGDNVLVRYLEERAWVVNLDEYQADPELYSPLVLPDWVVELPRAWLLVPLLDQDRLLGIVVLTQPRASVPFNWELRDLLRTAASQAASHLAQLEAVEALAEARQFEGFHRLSAFVLHDIKNLIAQQSLLVGTAARHKHKPEFIDDAIDIMAHSVAKMQRLMQLLRTGVSSGKSVRANLVTVVRDAVENCAAGRPVPRYECDVDEIWLTLDRDRMTSVIENLIQNAQDATPEDGVVNVSLTRDDERLVVIISDNGCGMDAAFVRDRLFRPFDTTKGDTGMGIGAYECREFVHSLNGELQIESEPGKGTSVRIVLPDVATVASEEDILPDMESQG